jgi:NADH dehydrogenase FAD-containing subunit
MHVPRPAAPTVAVIGGGYGGTLAARALDDVADVVLVEPKDAFVHNIAALRAVVDPAWAPRMFLPYDRLLTNGRVVRDRAAEVSSDRVVLASGEELHPDYVILATGSSYPFPAKSDIHDAEGATAKYRALNAELAAAGSVLLLGAGPVGIELAGEITSAWPDKRVILADVADDILPGPYMPELRDELRRQLAERNVELVLGSADPAAEVDADVVLRTHGVTPETGYLAGDLAAARTADGRVTVTPELQVAGHDNVFAIGDIAAGHAQKGATAMRQAPVAAANVRALITGEGNLEAFEPPPPAIVVPLGPAGGAGQLPGADEVAGPEAVSEIKGRHMMVDPVAAGLGLESAKTS